MHGWSANANPSLAGAVAGPAHGWQGLRIALQASASGRAEKRAKGLRRMRSPSLDEPARMGFSIGQTFIRPLRDRWILVLAIPAVLMLLVILAQALATPKYTVSAVITATRQDSDGLSRQLGQLGGFAALAGASLGTSEKVTPFEKFQFLLTSERLAAFHVDRRSMLPLVFSVSWDARTQQWQRPSGLGQTVRDLVYPMFGLNPWSAPDYRTLARRYAQNLTIRGISDTGLVEIAYEDSDPERARLVLEAMFEDANTLLREEAKAQAETKATYLRTQLGQAEIIEYRVNLANLLAREEQILMLTSTSGPFAAELVQPYVVSPQPTSQRPLVFAIVAALVGFSISIFVALLLGPREKTA